MIRKKPALGLDPRVDTGFPETSCSTKDLERDVYSTQNHRALGTIHASVGPIAESRAL